MSTNPLGMNNSTGEASVKAAAGEENAHGPANASSSSSDNSRQQQSNEEISDLSDKQLKALLDEAMTYKNPKDLAHKSETFKELLKRAETEEQESNFVCIPFTSSGGGSLQNIFESVNSEPRKFSSAGLSNRRLQHISAHRRAGGTGAVGSGGGGNHQQQQSHHSNHRGHAASGTGGFVSSRQGEGGSLPSNVNTRSAEVRFIAEMEAVPRRRGPKNNSESGRSSDDYEMGVLNGGEAMSKAAARSVAARGTSLGLDTDIPYAQMASPCSENMSVIINMGEYGTEDQDEESLLVITNQAKKVTSHQAQHLQQNYRTNLKIDFEHGAADHEKNGNGSSSGNSVTVGGYEKLSTASGLSGAGGALSGGGSREVPSVTYEQVDKSIKMSLEPKTSLDSLTNAYGSLKNGRGDQKSEMIIVTPSLVAQSHDREMSTDLDWTRSMSMVQSKRLKHRRKYERNMTTIVSDEIIGFRGEEMDLDRLVQFIESKENEQQTGPGSTGRPQEAKGKGKNKGTNKKDHQAASGKLKKSNSMNELRSCSKLDEITSEKESSEKVVLRPKAVKNSNKGTTNQTEGKGHSSAATNEVKAPATANGKRGDRRSWGTEELQYLGETDAAAGDSFIVDTNNNTSALKKNNKKQDKSAELSIPTKTLGELPVNSVSMESLVSSSWANEEFHVVTKKRKAKKKQSIVVQPFEVDRRTFNHQVTNGGGKQAAQQPLFVGSQKSAKNRPNNLVASITHTNSSSSSHRMGSGSAATITTTASSRASSTLHPSACQSKSRRKSTSSVPPSDPSDCSDLDSVHSLPIESPSTTKSKAKAKSKGKQSGGVAVGTGNGAHGVSYADITKTAHSQKPPPQVTAVNGNSGATSGAVDDRDIKWPLIDGRLEATAREEESAAAKWVNGEVAEEMLPKMSDIIKKSQAAVVRSTEVINVSASALTAADLSGVVGGNKTLLQKSKSVDNESSGFNMNIDQYPSLEKTVNKKQAPASVVGQAVANKDSSVAQTPQSSSSPQGLVNGGVAGKKLKLLSSIVSDSSSQPTATRATTTTSSAENTVNRVSSNHVATSSAVVSPVLPNNNSHNERQPEEVEVREPFVEVNSREKMAVKSNNNLSAVTSSAAPPATGAAVDAEVKEPTQHQQFAKGPPGVGKTGNVSKSNRSRTTSMPQMAPNAASATASQPMPPQAQQRPAVIILNDERYNSLNESSDITFGFDVNNQLLFGDFEEDEIRFLEPCAEGAGTAEAGGSRGGEGTAVLLNESAKNVDQINTSDYNSYNSSMCSSSSVKGSSAGVASTEGLVFDSNNAPNDETAEELMEVPPVPQPQSTPKQASMVNCTNCTQANAADVGAVVSAVSEVVVGEEVTLMKNLCGASVENLIMVPGLSNSSRQSNGGAAVVVTVSDLESRNAAVAAAANGKKKKKSAANTNTALPPPNWADASAPEGERAGGEPEAAAGGDGEGFNSIKVKLQQFALINAQFARQAPMGWMCNQMNSFFNNHENVINFVGLAWEDLTHTKNSALKYYNGQ